MKVNPYLNYGGNCNRFGTSWMIINQRPMPQSA
jgi:hypothetical protein